ncbi:MarR family transcriptional regulator [Endozoicomonas sp. SM1973]|uniref:MarR family transcriptional regulator n=1 Tax=Spartinivicinus marinus TaxID=2994442 RepID=A0A853INN9_9GAMM|nr:MarR family transcriptional regulator [Spartinivicinus marinus]NYZ69466.1 MarR family transcriptional regulator [Spartinivicinus marinus]
MNELISLSVRFPRMTVRTLAILRTIKENEGLTIRQLSKVMGVDERSVLTTIRRLGEGKAGNFDSELIQSKPHPNDRRSRLFYLSSEGRRMLR